MRDSAVRYVFRLGIGAIALLASLSVAAETENYVFEIPPDQTVSYNLGFVPKNAGTLTIRAEWTGDRVLSIHLKQPNGRRSAARRSGPSPQIMHFDIRDTEPFGESFWMLSLRTVGGSDAGQGQLEINLPESPEAGVKPPVRSPAASRPQVSEAPVFPLRAQTSPSADWVLSRPLPAKSNPSFRFQQAVEQLRESLVDPVTGEPTTDPCHWHEELMTYLDRWSADYSERRLRPDETHREYLEHAATAVDNLARLRNGRDPLIHGPIPETRSRYLAWLAVRERKLRPLERSLDELRTLPQDGFAPQLVDENWPRLFGVCLLSVERYLDRRIIDLHEGGPNPGSTVTTPGSELEAGEWIPIRRAGTALRELAALPSP